MRRCSASYPQSRNGRLVARPLIEAARFGHDEVVTALLIAKADVKTKNDEGKTALMLAAEGGHDETVRVLTQGGAGK